MPACSVVYHSIPTSNHNSKKFLYILNLVVYHSIPTSNHNSRTRSCASSIVVYHSIPTSNHNFRKREATPQALFITLFLHQTTTVFMLKCLTIWLFITLFLHQTTTLPLLLRYSSSCLSLYSYIKPQRETA